MTTDSPVSYTIHPSYKVQPEHELGEVLSSAMVSRHVDGPKTMYCKTMDCETKAAEVRAVQRSTVGFRDVETHSLISINESRPDQRVQASHLLNNDLTKGVSRVRLY